MFGKKKKAKKAAEAAKTFVEHSPVVELIEKPETAVPNAPARRVTIYRDVDGKWRYRVQARNWRVIEAAEQGLRKDAVLRRIEKRWPGVELVEGEE